MKQWDSGHIIIFLAMAFATAFGCSWFNLINNDIWYHMTAGKLILDQGSIPRSDPFSYTRSGAPWVPHSWLAEVLFYKLYSAGGIQALLLLRSFVTGLIVVVLAVTFRTLKCGWVSAVVAALLACLVFHYRLLVQPHLFSILGLALLLLFDTLRRQGKKWAWIGLVVGMVLWANIHSGVIFGLIYLGCRALGESVSAVILRRGFPVKQILLFWTVPLVCFGAALVNPLGLESLLYPVKLSGAKFTFSYIGEFRQPQWGDLFPGILLFAAIGLLRLFWRDKRPSLGEGIAFALFLFYALRVRRGGDSFAVVASPWVAATLSVVDDRLHQTLPRFYMVFACLVVPATCVLVLTIHPPDFKAGVDPRHPVGGAQFIAEENLPGNMYNEIGTGGYLIWRLWPERKVFVDGRLEVYGAEFNEYEYGWIGYGAEGWEEKLRAWDVNYILLRYGARVSTLLYESPNWTLIYFDDACMIFLQNRPENDPWLKRWECKVIQPDDPFMEYLKDHQSAAQAVKEAERLVQIRPKAYRPRVILGAALAFLGQFHDAEIQLKAAIELNPKGADAFNNLAVLYAAQGQMNLAGEYWKRALKNDPKNESVQRNLERLKTLKAEGEN